MQCIWEYMLSPLHADPWLVDLIMGKCHQCNSCIYGFPYINWFLISYPHMLQHNYLSRVEHYICHQNNMSIVKKKNANKSQVTLWLYLDRYLCNDWKLFGESNMTFDVQTLAETLQKTYNSFQSIDQSINLSIKFLLL